MLGKRIVAANAAIANTTTAVKLRVGKTVIETPRKAGLGWVDALANYLSIAADGTPQVCVPVYSLTINGDTGDLGGPAEIV